MSNWKEHAGYDLDLPAGSKSLAMLPPVSDAHPWHLTVMDDTQQVVCIHPESVPYVITRMPDGMYTCEPLEVKTT